MEYNSQMIRALINAYKTTYDEWIGRIPSLATTNPVTTQDADALAATTALRNSYFNRWSSIIETIKEETRVQITQAQSLETWRSAPTSTSVSVSSKTTKGLGQGQGQT